MAERDRQPSHEDVTHDGSNSVTSASFGSNVSNLDAILEIGSVLGGRYEILEMLGLGGMGAVYRAQDRELDRVIALKVILPDIARHPEALTRFRQELLTARQVTHKNVVRIFDIGEADGIKFITMEYVPGRDLRSLLLDKGKLPVSEALPIVRQICSALAAAHAEGVIHRDLKPGNIMQDGQGRIVVMDFGLARSLEDTAKMTQTGAMLGTVQYMSPEQAMAGKLDARSDLFTIGLISYELLTGNTPYAADSALASLVKRTQERAIPAVEVDPSIPKPVSDLVSKCLERDPANRFQTADEIIQCIDEIEGKRPPSSIIYVPVPPTKVKQWTILAISAAVFITLAVGITLFFKQRGGSAVNHKPVTVLMADFSNVTSDEVFEGTLEPAFALSLEGAPFITTYNRASARKELNQIKPGAPLNEENARLLAVRNGVGVVITGSVAKQPEGYMLTSSAVDAVTGKTISAQNITAADKSSVLKAVGSIANKIRTDLGDTTPASEKLAQRETYTSDSLPAVHEYAQAQDLRYSGKTEEAIKGFSKAIELDTSFGSAYAALGALYWNQGNQVESVKNYRLAMEHIDRMTERERLRTRGGYYLAVADGDKAIEEFSSLVKQYPADTMGLSSLAFAYYLRRDMNKALEECRKAIAIYPKNVVYRNNAALYAMYAADYDSALKEAQSVLDINPAYDKAYVTIELAQIGKGKPDEAAETLKKLSTVSATGAWYSANGFGDLALYQGDPAKAVTVLQKSIADMLAAKNSSAAAKQSAMLAEANWMLGKKSDAAAAINKAVSLDKANVLFRAARIYVLLGDESKAASLASTLSGNVEPAPQAQGKLIEGELLLSKGKAKEAIRAFQGSQRISDTWLSRFDLARAYIDAQAFTEANTELENCSKRRGEATDIFTDEEATFRFFPATYYYLGRALEGMKSRGSADAYKSFLALKSKDAQDLLVADARKRLGNN